MSYTIGITGSSGFIGTHLKLRMSREPELYHIIPFSRAYFEDGAEARLDAFVSSCDVVVHLAALNRDPDQQAVYDVNMDLARRLGQALDRTGSQAHVIMASSVHEDGDSAYGRAKHDAREFLAARSSRGVFTGLVIPNTFGPFGVPFHNSFISTFCHVMAAGGEPQVSGDASVGLIPVGNVCETIVQCIRDRTDAVRMELDHLREIRVLEVVGLLRGWRDLYLHKNTIPVFSDRFELHLFTTFCSFLSPADRYPVRLASFADDRGVFTEVLRHQTSGQVSFSTTLPGITRGNHYHTRKIERFAVLKGKAVIRMRRIDSDEVLEFELDGQVPAFVDMPVFFTHSITNCGEEPLYTLFWISEAYDAADPDTFFVPVVSETHDVGRPA
jgi:UDP-2-acetamido-2,6-beta-L-arabino-hexul-4-ose reductase